MAPRKTVQLVFNVTVYGESEPCGERPKVQLTIVAPDVGTAILAGEEAFVAQFPKFQATNANVEQYSTSRPVIVT